MNVTLTIETTPKSVTFFSLPKVNDYQDVSELVIGSKKENFSLEKDQFFNTILAILGQEKKTANNISFSLMLKKRIESVPKNLLLSDYSSSQKKQVINSNYLNGSDPEIIKLANLLYKNEQNLSNLIDATYKYCLKNFHYGLPIEGLHTFKQALTEKTTDCGGFSTLIGSLLQAKQIPTRLVVGYVFKKNQKKIFVNKLVKQKYTFDDLSMHAWLEVLLPNDSWFPIDASIEWRRIHGLSKRSGGLGIIPADRLVLSYGHNNVIHLKNKKYTIEILQRPVTLSL